MPSPSTTATGQHLTTSRIHRILRPLKTKCAGFASTVPSTGGNASVGAKTASGSRHRASRTNSSSSSSANPPLAVLPPPGLTCHSKSTSQYDSTWSQLSLSKNIYGIRDAFKNIINIAFGAELDDSSSKNSASSSVDDTALASKSHIVSLAGLCAIVIGRELGQEGCREGEEESTDDENCGNEEEEATKWIDEIYEGIPLHVRRWAVVSHALQIILQSCPHHPTLLHLLLEVFRTHPHSSDLIPLAERILRSLIVVSFTSPSNPTAIAPLPPPVCHPAHPAFLTSLLSLWRDSSLGDSETFLSILLDVSAHGASEAWTSRAILDLAKEVSQENFSSLVRMATRLVEIIAQSKHKTSKVDKRLTERRIALLLKWLRQILDQLVYTDYVEGDTELCLRCLELISVYFGSDLGTRLLSKDEKSANEVDSVMINITTWFLAVFPPAFSLAEDAKRLVRSLQTSHARPAIFTPLIGRFFGSVSDDEVPWDMLDQLHSFASALNSNELYELELSMVKHILKEFQSVFGVTLGYEPEYERIMRDLQESIENAEGAIRAAAPRNTRASSSKLISPFVTPLVPRRRYLPLPQSRYAHRRDSSPTPYRQRSRSQSPPPSSLLKSKSRTAIPPPPKFPSPFPQPPPSTTPLKKRKRATFYIELTPWVVKKRRMLAQEQPHTPKNHRTSFGDQTLFDIDPGAYNSAHSQDRLIRVIDKERHSSADTASSSSPTSLRTRLIASMRCNRAPSPSPGPPNDEDNHVSETSEESEHSEGEGDGFDSDQEDEEASILPTSEDPLNLFALSDSSPRVRFVRNKKPLPRTALSLSP